MKKNRLKSANDQLKTLLGITELGFEDKFPVEILSSFQTGSYLIRDKGEVSDKISYEFHISDDKSSVLSGIRFSIISKEINAILDLISSKPELSHIPKYMIVLDSYEDTIIDEAILKDGADLVREICSIKFIENEILNEDKLVKVADLCKVYINDFMQPFFNSINSIQDINDKIIENIKDDVWSKSFSKDANSKATIVMKICNNPRYETFSRSFRNKLHDAIYNKGLIQYKEYYKIYITLLEYLDSEEYKQDTV